MSVVVAEHEVAVIGLGIYGSAIVQALGASGIDVVGLDALRPPHDCGSSHGGSRLFRFTTLEDEAYVPLARRAAIAWEWLQARHPGTLLHRDTGFAVIEAQEARGQQHHGRFGVVDEALRLARNQAIPHELLTGRLLHERYASLLATDADRVYFEPGAFVLDAEACHRAMLQEAGLVASDLLFDEPVLSLQQEGTRRVRLALRSGRAIEVGRVIVCAGSWLTHLLPKSPVQVFPQSVGLFHPLPGRAPALLPFVRIQATRPLLFGFPEITPGAGVKLVAENESLSLVRGEEAQARGQILSLHMGLLHEVQAAIADLADRPTSRHICYYTSTVDGRLLLQTLHGSGRISFVSACSGHGFKYAPAVAERIARAVSQGQTLDTQILRC